MTTTTTTITTARMRDKTAGRASKETEKGKKTRTWIEKGQEQEETACSKMAEKGDKEHEGPRKEPRE